MPVGAEQREQKKRVKEQNRGTLQPSPDGINAHRVGGNSNHSPQWEQQALWPNRFGGGAENDKGRYHDKDERGENVRQREGRVRRECPIERGQLGRGGVRRIRERKPSPDDHRKGNDDACPETNTPPT